METGYIIGMIMMGLCLLALFILMMVGVLRDCGSKKQETKDIVQDAEYDELIKQYGYDIVLEAKLNLCSNTLNGKENTSLADECWYIKYLRDKKQEKQDAQIRYIKSLSKEELELYLLRKEAIKQIEE